MAAERAGWLEAALVSLSDQGVGVDEIFPFSGGTTDTIALGSGRSPDGDENLFPFDQFHWFEGFQEAVGNASTDHELHETL